MEGRCADTAAAVAPGVGEVELTGGGDSGVAPGAAAGGEAAGVGGVGNVELTGGGDSGVAPDAAAVGEVDMTGGVAVGVGGVGNVEAADCGDGAGLRTADGNDDGRDGLDGVCDAAVVVGGEPVCGRVVVGCSADDGEVGGRGGDGCSLTVVASIVDCGGGSHGWAAAWVACVAVESVASSELPIRSTNDGCVSAAADSDDADALPLADKGEVGEIGVSDEPDRTELGATPIGTDGGTVFAPVSVAVRDNDSDGAEAKDTASSASAAGIDDSSDSASDAVGVLSVACAVNADRAAACRAAPGAELELLISGSPARVLALVMACA
ncbi:hypothetical protein [Mycobacterium haemophilum]